MHVAKINFAIFANRYYSQPLFSAGRSGKLLPRPTTTNNKHHDHDEDFALPAAWFDGSPRMEGLPRVLDRFAVEVV
jgi:hypothetical protein